MIQIALSISHSAQSVLGLFHQTVAKVDWISVMSGQQEKADDLSIIAFQDVPYCKKFPLDLDIFSLSIVI